MPRCTVSTPVRNKLKDLMGEIRRHMPYRHQLTYEWPYTAGSLCLMALLISQPQQPSLQPAAHSAQSSLLAIDSNCYQVHIEALDNQHCESCGNDQVTDSRLDADFKLSRSLLTCKKVQSVPLNESSTGNPDNLRIEVIKSNHSF